MRHARAYLPPSAACDRAARQGGRGGSCATRPCGGVALVVVLVAVAMLSLAGLAFSELMLTERKAAELSARRTQARALANSGLEMARLFVVREQEVQDDAGGWYDNPESFQAVLVVDDAEGAQNRGRFTFVAPQMENGLLGGVRFGLQDESTRLNLNALTLADQAASDGGRQALIGLPGMTEEIADAIMDWIDSDDEIREFGAEVDYYSSLQPSYAPKNGPLETVEELLLVRGVTPCLLFGSDANRNGQLDAGETGADVIEGVDNSDGSMNCGWTAYLTLHSLEENVQPDGQPMIDLNQSDMNTLHSELEAVDGISSEWAAFIIACRQNQAYTGTKPGQPATADQLDLSKAGNVKLETVLDLIGRKIEIAGRENEESTVLASPFPDMPGVMNAYLPVLMDHLAASNTSQTIPGRININQAPRTVLIGIPGMTEQIADEIISQRVEDPTQAEPYQRHATWILSMGIVTLEEMKALLPFVTGGGRVYRAQVVGYFDQDGPAVRLEAILNATTSPARVISWRDISHLGRGYALETLGIEAPEF